MLVREFILRYVDKESRTLEKKTGVWGSQGEEKDKHFFYIALSLSISQCILLKDMFLLKKNLLTNVVILRCMLWEWVW